MRDLANLEVRQAMKKKRLFYYEVADVLGIAPESFSRLLRQELSEDKKNKILTVIQEYDV